MNNQKVVKGMLAALMFVGMVSAVSADTNSTKKNVIVEANKMVANSCALASEGWQKEACEELKDANDEVEHELDHIDAHHAHAGDEVEEEYNDAIAEIEDAIEEIPHESVRKGLTSLLNKVVKKFPFFK